MSATTCARCGEPIPPGARYCAKCGADISGAQGNVATAYVSQAALDQAATAEASLLDLLRRATLGDYDVQAELGRGGMATVFLAHEIALDRKVAIKVMSPALLTGPGAAERFKREARTSASLSHPNIIPIYAVKEGAKLLYFVMKFVEGRALDSVVKEVGPLPLPLVQPILHQVGDALGYAHRRGIIHRDIKPANIMVDSDGHTIVTDFGIAKVVEAKGLTMTGTTVGTPAYMSPEQCANRDMSGASDQYSLGIVAYEMLTGQPPFEADTLVGLLYAQCHTPPPPIAGARPDLPKAIAAAVMRMLEKDPGKRFPNVEDAVKALGGTPLDLDDPRREEMKLLALKGTAAELRQRVRTPASPVPAGRAQVPPTGSAPGVPTTRISERSRAGAGPGTRPRVWLFSLLGVAAVAAVVLAITRPWQRRVTTLAGPVAVRDTTAPAVTPAPAQGSPRDSLPPTGTRRAAPPGPARLQNLAQRSPTPSPVASAAPNGDSAFQTLRTEARGQRDRAVAAGATAGDLATGDLAARNADALSGEGRMPGAMTRLVRATALWAQAERAARGRTADAEAARSAAASPPPSAAPTPAAPDQVTAALQAVVTTYARALESRTIAQVRRAYPGLNLRQEENMRRFFQRAQDLRVRLELTDVHREGEGAEGRVVGDYAYTSPTTHVTEHQPVLHRVAFQRLPRGWVLTAIE
jgi:serine/threonine protein kinase